MHEQIVNLWELQEDTGCLQSADASYFLDQGVLSNKTPCVDRGHRIIIPNLTPFLVLLSNMFQSMKYKNKAFNMSYTWNSTNYLL
mgnify:CR=1 FL=1